MVQLFISSSEADAECGAQVRSDLEARGYHIWRNTKNTDNSSVSYPRGIENGIRGSAAIVVVWSSSASQSEWVERHILFAQRLQKPVFPVVIDGTDLPITLVNVPSVTSSAPCANVVIHLLPHLPPSDNNDLLLALLTHEYIRDRKAGIEQAAELLKKGERREEVLALLEDITRKDLIQSVREMAQAVIDANVQQEASSPPEESRHIFRAKCSNGHVSYFDKRRECPASSKVKRSVSQRAGAQLDELYLKCTECGIEMAVPVDCEGYK